MIWSFRIRRSVLVCRAASFSLNLSMCELSRPWDSGGTTCHSKEWSLSARKRNQANTPTIFHRTVCLVKIRIERPEIELFIRTPCGDSKAVWGAGDREHL